MQIRNELARGILLVIVLALGFLTTYWVYPLLGTVYLLVSIILLAGAKYTGRGELLIASRFWILVLPFIGVLNGPQKIWWFLAFLVTSWIASKNAFEK